MFIVLESSTYKISSDRSLNNIVLSRFLLTDATLCRTNTIYYICTIYVYSTYIVCIYIDIFIYILRRRFKGICSGRQTVMWRHGRKRTRGQWRIYGDMGNNSSLLNLPVYSGKAATNGEKLMCQIKIAGQKPSIKNWSERRWVSGCGSELKI